jgi:hypothetical protein
VKRIVAYLLVVVAVDLVLLGATHVGAMPPWWNALGLAPLCALVGGVGGCLYCLRAVYLNACVRKSWDDSWQPWYYIRPLVSHLSGAASYLFAAAGLLVLDASHTSRASSFGFLALAFVAGLNVDRFIGKIEDLAKATWGIEKSRTATASDKPETDEASSAA